MQLETGESAFLSVQNQAPSQFSVRPSGFWQDKLETMILGQSYRLDWAIEDNGNTVNRREPLSIRYSQSGRADPIALIVPSWNTVKLMAKASIDLAWATLFFLTLDRCGMCAWLKHGQPCSEPGFILRRVPSQPLPGGSKETLAARPGL